MKTFVQMGDRVGKRLVSGFRSGDHGPCGQSTRNGSASGRRVFKRWFTLVSCGVLSSFLATFVPVSESNAAPREFDFLSEETTKAIDQELGVKLLYMFGVTNGGRFVIGVPPRSKIESFEDQFELWKVKQRILIKEVQSLEIIRFRRNPLEQCFPYPAFGSIRWYCVTVDVD